MLTNKINNNSRMIKKKKKMSKTENKSKFILVTPYIIICKLMNIVNVTFSRYSTSISTIYSVLNIG